MAVWWWCIDEKSTQKSFQNSDRKENSYEKSIEHKTINSALTFAMRMLNVCINDSNWKNHRKIVSGGILFGGKKNKDENKTSAISFKMEHFKTQI